MFCHHCGPVTADPKPHLSPKQTPFLPSLSLLLPLAPLRRAASTSLTHSPPPFDLSPPVPARTPVRLTKMEQEDRRNSADDRTLSLPCFSPRRL